MSHPYQCLYYCQRSDQLGIGFLVGASGGCIHTFNTQNGRYLSTWPHSEKIARGRLEGQKSDQDSEVLYAESSPHDDSNRPTKRQKLSLVRDESGSSSAEIVVAKNSNYGESSCPEQPMLPQVIKLTGTSNGQHVIAVTGEDKCVRVFDLAADGTLKQISERQGNAEWLHCSVV